VVKVDRRIRWHYTILLYFAFALVHDSRGIEIVNFTTAAALSAGTLMASAGTPYCLVPAHFYPWLDHMQTMCTSLQTYNHTNTLSLNFYRPDALPDAQPTVSMSKYK